MSAHSNLDNKPRGVPARVAAKTTVASSVVTAVKSGHVKQFGKADAGSVAPAVRPAAPWTARAAAPTPPASAGTFGHATIPARFQAGPSSAPPKTAGAAPVAKNRDTHPASAPHAAHSNKTNRR